jgi:GNAT superfamily N-acetyltransferase
MAPEWYMFFRTLSQELGLETRARAIPSMTESERGTITVGVSLDAEDDQCLLVDMRDRQRKQLPAVLVRMIKHGDEDIVIAMLEEMWCKTKADRKTLPFDKCAARFFVQRALEQNDVAMFVAVDDRFGVVGLIMVFMAPLLMTPTGVCADALHIWVDEKHRRKGIGHKLIAETAKWAKSCGASFFVLTARGDDIGVARGYLNDGFRLLEAKYLKRL